MGEIGKPHGVSGEVYVLVVSDDPARFAPGSRLVHDDGRILTVASARSHRNRFLVKFEGSESREDALELRGPLYADASTARELAPDEFWQHDMIGLEVTLTDGSSVGTVTGVNPGPAQDLLVVATQSGERLVPFVRAIVRRVDPDTGVVVIDPPEGLLE